ncbi:MAG: alpha/beta fold hydrolase, partial [Myxococcota bacterium]
FGRWLLTRFGYRSRAVDTSVGAVHLLARDGGGELPPVLLIHGFGAAAMQWVPLVRALRPHVRSVWAIDLPGHGFSHRPDRLTLDVLRDGVIEALDQVHSEIGPAVVVGNSLGGAVALRYAHARPDRAVAVHLLSPGGAPMAPDELREVQRLFRVVTHTDATTFLDRLYATPRGWTGHLLAPFVRRVFADPALHDLLAEVTDADWLTPDEVRQLPHPLRVSWGRLDRILPAAAVGFWRAHLPDRGELDEPEAFGHVPQLDSPGRTAADIVAFTRRAVLPRGGG